MKNNIIYKNIRILIFYIKISPFFVMFSQIVFVKCFYSTNKRAEFVMKILATLYQDYEGSIEINGSKMKEIDKNLLL